MNSFKPAPALKKRNMIAGEPGILLQHGREIRDGKTFRTWRTGRIKGREEYSIGEHGELRHTYPQFKGSKKKRKKLKALLVAASKIQPPEAYVELEPTDELIALDLLLDVVSGRWAFTSLIKIKVEQLRLYFPLTPRAARAIKCDGKHDADKKCADAKCWLRKPCSPSSSPSSAPASE